MSRKYSADEIEVTLNGRVLEPFNAISVDTPYPLEFEATITTREAAARMFGALGVALWDSYEARGITSIPIKIRPVKLEPAKDEL